MGRSWRPPWATRPPSSIGRSGSKREAGGGAPGPEDGVGDGSAVPAGACGRSTSAPIRRRLASRRAWIMSFLLWSRWARSSWRRRWRISITERSERVATPPSRPGSKPPGGADARARTGRTLARSSDSSERMRTEADSIQGVTSRTLRVGTAGRPGARVEE